MLKPLTSLALVSLLASCGASTSVLRDGTNAGSRLSNDGSAILAQWANTLPTEASNMPQGSFSYEGVVAFSQSHSLPTSVFSNADVTADIALNANFNAGTVTGSVGNTRQLQGAGSGSIPVSGSVSPNNITVSGAGQVRDYRNRLVGLSVNLEGTFYGNGANMALGSGASEFSERDYNAAFIVDR